MNLVVIGLGGINSHFLLPVYQYLQYENNIFDSLILVDGDKYELKNESRQIVPDLDNKAIATTKMYRDKFDGVTTTFYDKYINESNINKVIKNNDVIILGVDNHKTRKVVQDYCKKLENITIISGGNELHDGNVMIFNRKDNITITPLFTELHPEILNSKDKSPEEMSCEELAQSEPQIGLVNATIADAMRRTLYALINNQIRYYEIFINCLTGSTRTIKFDDINKSINIKPEVQEDGTNETSETELQTEDRN